MKSLAPINPKIYRKKVFFLNYRAKKMIILSFGINYLQTIRFLAFRFIMQKNQYQNFCLGTFLLLLLIPLYRIQALNADSENDSESIVISNIYENFENTVVPELVSGSANATVLADNPGKCMAIFSSIKRKASFQQYFGELCSNFSSSDKKLSHCPSQTVLRL